jgi:hypothetical protein
MLDEKSKQIKTTENTVALSLHQHQNQPHQRISSNLNAQKFTIKELEQRYAFKSDEDPSPAIVKDTINYMKKYFRPSPKCMKNFFFERLPFLSWLSVYDIKGNLLKDFIAGLTVSVFHISKNKFLIKFLFYSKKN